MEVQPRSAAELLQEIEAKYGKEAESKLTYEEAMQAKKAIIYWVMEHNLPVQDYIATRCQEPYSINEIAGLELGQEV